MDGTEALDGRPAPPPVDGSLAGSPDAGQGPDPGQPPAAPAAPPGAPDLRKTPDLGGSQAPDLGAPSAPAVAVAQPKSMLDRLGDAVIDFLSPSKQTTQVRDDNGVMHTLPAKSQTRGQQWSKVGLEALEGAATAAAAPSGPNHIGQGVAAAVGQQLQHSAQEDASKTEQANQDFAFRQKAKQDNLNFALGQRDLAAKTFELTRRGVAATQDDITFAQKQEDREKQMGSFDLATVPGAMDLHTVMEKQPDFFKRLDKNLIVGVPVYNSDGQRTGLHLYERKPEAGAQPAPAGSQFAVFTPGAKPGEAPHMEWKTAASGQYSNDDITRFNTKAMTDSMGFAKSTADIAETKAKTNETNAHASEVPSIINKNNAEAVQARAGAAKDYAEARKTKIDANNAGGTGEGGTGNLQQDAHMMVDGLASPSQFSKRSKDYNSMLPEANRYSLQKYGVTFDAEISEGRYDARKKTIQAFGSGKEGDQIQTFNQFLAHAGDLSNAIDGLRNTNVAVLNKPLKDLRKALGETQYAAIEPMISAVRTEHGNFLNNNHALHSEDIRDGADMLNDTQTLGQSQAAIKAFAHTAIARAGALNQRYRRVVGVGDVPDLLDPYSHKVISGLGMDSVAQGALGTAWSKDPTTPQNATTPPVPNGQTVAQPQAPQQQGAPLQVPATTVSLTAARGLPANRGKTDAQITADIQSHGHKVVN